MSDALPRHELLSHALQLRSSIAEQIEAILRHHYPPGSEISWQFHGRVQHGRVVTNCYRDRIKVENAATGKQRLIYAARITS